jgi:ribosomal protein S27E
MPVPPRMVEIRVQCANCRERLEIEDHSFRLPAEWPVDRTHVVERVQGFVGTVGCPTCGHFTTYTRREGS